MIDKKAELRRLINTYAPGACNYRGAMVYDALTFAYEAHGDQVRKYTGEPYLFHPIEVMHIVEITTYGSWHASISERAMCAAILHDVVEDTPRTLEEVDAHFGTVVAQWVGGMTAPSKPEDGNRAARMKIDVEHLRQQSSYVQTIKCADIISNAKDFATVCTDKKFAKQYMEEKWDALRACNSALLATKMIAESVVTAARLELA